MDLEKFKISAARKKKGLRLFLDKVDKLIPEDMPELVARIDEAVWKKVDCLECANCCKTMTPTYTPEDITRISAHFNMSPDQFKKKYVVKEADTGNWVSAEIPCQFLDGNKCSIYAIRPIDCAEFPHHNKTPFDEYSDTFRANIIHCPATYLLIDKLKKIVETHYEWEE